MTILGDFGIGKTHILDAILVRKDVMSCISLTCTWRGDIHCRL